MADTALTPIELPNEAALVLAAGEDIAGTPFAIAGDAPAHDTFLLVNNTSPAAQVVTVTVEAGVAPPAMNAEALEVEVAAGKTAIIGPLDGSRHVKADGSIAVAVEVDTDGTGDIAAYVINRDV